MKPKIIDFVGPGQTSRIPKEEIPPEDRLEEPVTFYAPFHKYFMVRLDQPLPPKQTKAKTKNRVFEKLLRKELELVGRDSEMPYQDKLAVTVTVCGPESYVQHVDLDNMVKAVLDCLNGIFFIDDRQVFELQASKHVRADSSVSVGILRLELV